MGRIHAQTLRHLSVNSLIDSQSHLAIKVPFFLANTFFEIHTKTQTWDFEIKSARPAEETRTQALTMASTKPWETTRAMKTTTLSSSNRHLLDGTATADTRTMPHHLHSLQYTGPSKKEPVCQHHPTTTDTDLVPGIHHHHRRRRTGGQAGRTASTATGAWAAVAAGMDTTTGEWGRSMEAGRSQKGVKAPN